MVTASQVKSYLRPLIEANDDLALVGRLLLVKPVRHVLRGVIVDRRSTAERAAPIWFLDHTFGPHPDYHISWGEELRSRRFKAWRTTEPEFAGSLVEEIESVALPVLRSVKTLEDFTREVLKTRCGHLWSKDPQGKSLIDVAMGDVESAKRLCRDDICSISDPGVREAPKTKDRAAGAKTLCALLENDDIEGLVRTLHEWEARNVKHLKLEAYWEPSPFPIEVKLGMA